MAVVRTGKRSRGSATRLILLTLSVSLGWMVLCLVIGRAVGWTARTLGAGPSAGLVVVVLTMLGIYRVGLALGKRFLRRYY